MTKLLMLSSKLASNVKYKHILKISILCHQESAAGFNYYFGLNYGGVVVDYCFALLISIPSGSCFFNFSFNKIFSSYTTFNYSLKINRLFKPKI